MKKQFRKVLAMATVLSFLLAAGCGTAQNQPAGTTEAQTQQTAQVTTAAAEKPDPYAKMPEPVTLRTGAGVGAEPKYPEGESIENNDIVKWIKDNMNIEIKYDWTVSDQNNEPANKLNLLIASNEIPDFFTLGIDLNGTSILKKLISSDMIEDCTKIYEDYASPTFKEMHSQSGNVALAKVTYDGKLMAIPSLADTETAIPVMWYRQDMLDKAGLQPPKTVDDVINIVKTLNEKGITKGATLPARADGEYLVNGDTATFDWLFGAYNAYPANWIKAKDGSITYGSIQPEVKQALAKAQEMYKQGIFAPDFALMDGNKAVESIANNKVGIFMGAWWSTWWPLQDSVKNDPKAVWKAAVLEAADGNHYARSYDVSRVVCVIRKGLPHPEAIMKLINVNEDISLKKCDWYNKLVLDEGAKYKETLGILFPYLPGAKYLDEITRRYTAIMDIVEGKTKMEDADTETKQLASQVIKEQQEPLKDIANWSSAVSWTEGAAAIKKASVIQNYPAYNGTTDTLQKSRAILVDLEKQTFLKIIMNKASVDEFDNFVEKWKQLGGEQVIKEINELVR